jgi:hypothetical protein
MKILKPLLFLAGLFAIYKVYEKSQVDSNETHLDGWQETARHMRPVPKSAIELANEAAPRAPLPRDQRQVEPEL